MYQPSNNSAVLFLTVWGCFVTLVSVEVNQSSIWQGYYSGSFNVIPASVVNGKFTALQELAGDLSVELPTSQTVFSAVDI